MRVFFIEFHTGNISADKHNLLSWKGNKKIKKIKNWTICLANNYNKRNWLIHLSSFYFYTILINFLYIFLVSF